ncbi:antibiotic biosynthesis monooxygenase [Microbulbifer agarilyticus]|uniref:Antibiotic biosynthesis monooxygenase n=1 Tax=Microbulbifer agarilyticus TaxID=260552 RepID=A0A1Q2M529_9GAMM|nr:putative quinol monooxygenase [Microbulbifer agarilyticus]AQQ67756.1 antibiotic biosynthesis monooxygenase [Microbulbifer agarilyticus]
MSLTVIGSIKAKPEFTEDVKTELLKLIPITRAEKGNIQYDLHQDNNDASYFLFFENWENRDLWQAHMEAEHLKAYMDAVDGKVEDFTLYEMTRIE